MNKQLIFDIETLGQNQLTAPIVCISSLVFDTDKFVSNTPYTMDELIDSAKFLKFDIKEQCYMHNRKPEPGTLDWWQNTVDSKIRERLLTPSDEDKPLSSIHTFLEEDRNVNVVWTRGNTFDPIFVTFACKDLGLDEPYDWWKIRDTRSYLDGLLYGFSMSNKFIPKECSNYDEAMLHDPRYDIALDIMRMQSVIRELEGCLNEEAPF